MEAPSLTISSCVPLDLNSRSLYLLNLNDSLQIRLSAREVVKLFLIINTFNFAAL